MNLLKHLIGPYLHLLIELESVIPGLEVLGPILSPDQKLLVEESKRQNWYVDRVVKLLSEIEVPEVAELKSSRVGKILNKIAKPFFHVDQVAKHPETSLLAEETMRRWKEYYQYKEDKGKPRESTERKREVKAQQKLLVTELKKKVSFAPIKQTQHEEWLAENRLASTCYYLISDEKIVQYKDVENANFAKQVYTLQQISELFPKLFCFQNVKEFRKNANLLDKVQRYHNYVPPSVQRLQEKLMSRPPQKKVEQPPKVIEDDTMMPIV